ncbi:3219_t:CDS:2 [Entrophospora sp. SA101]|nr:3219_t:CDS:2 [Entrophospora sp. SA101]
MFAESENNFRKLSENLVCKEISRVNNRIDKELEVGENLTIDVGIKIEQYKLIVEAAHEIWKSIDSCLKSEEILLS